MNAEQQRLAESAARTKHWKRWGSYIAERAWGTVREDYSATGEAWDYFPHDHARSRAYRWNEDGLAGICDRHQVVCFALALWNGRDPILKERLFGVSGTEGNHGEDVKEYYYYLDNTPTHSYMRFLYKYPQGEYPYAALVTESRRRGRSDPEYELFDTGLFNEDRYFDVFVEYAKADVDDICIRITAFNRGPEAAMLHLLPTLWFRNTWNWKLGAERPRAEAVSKNAIRSTSELGVHHLYLEGKPELLFTENDTDDQRLYNTPCGPFVKAGFHRYVVNGDKEAVNPGQCGTKSAGHYAFDIAPGAKIELKLRLQNSTVAPVSLGPDFDKVFAQRIAEADEFYRDAIPANVPEEGRLIVRQSLAGLLWSKQFYKYVVKRWLEGDHTCPPPPPQRFHGRNHNWQHIYNADVLSMPDKWEYPWYAAWDLGFHCVALAMVDPDYAKEQLVLLTREWYMHPNGQIPAYEWQFGDVNPPVHAWAAYKVYKIEKEKRGKGDRAFLERIFLKLLLNFTWWVNRKDAEGLNVFQGGFLGLDNIGVFDRSAKLPEGGHIEQSDGTSWMAMYSLDMGAIALELAAEDRVYEDVASKFWEHFVYIAKAMNHVGSDGLTLWDEQDGFFYDVLHLPDGEHFPLRVRSMVGLIPLFAVQTLEPELLERMPDFKKRLEWFIDNRRDLTDNLASMRLPGMGERRLLSIVHGEQLRRILRVMLDENEFLSPYG
ncbi:MAG TPA: glucosidase, partial [Terriglobales bacterium]|nr:glucosidase [Terriglobales bacterium]